jgi:phosphohistidine phosphatase
MKTLYLLRHAKAEPASKVISDQERSISARGHTACLAIGDYMKSKRYLPQFALCSPSARTRETLECVSEAASLIIEHRFENSLYLATAEEILNAIHSVSDDLDSLIIVGHNPGMHHAALLLAETNPGPLRATLELKYPTCALAGLRFACDRWRYIAANKGKLIDFVTPGEFDI